MVQITSLNIDIAFKKIIYFTAINIFTESHAKKDIWDDECIALRLARI